MTDFVTFDNVTNETVQFFFLKNDFFQKFNYNDTYILNGGDVVIMLLSVVCSEVEEIVASRSVGRVVTGLSLEWEV